MVVWFVAKEATVVDSLLVNLSLFLLSPSCS